jgi:hypothetical protein
MNGIGHGVATTWLLSALLFVLGSGLPMAAAAELIDDIEAHTVQGVAEIRLQFTVPVRYIKHFPADRGELIKLYLQTVGLENSEEVYPREYARTPAISMAPPFHVIYTTARTCFAVQDPLCLDIQFSKPVRFRIRPGNDGRSILLTVLPDSDPVKDKTEPANRH